MSNESIEGPEHMVFQPPQHVQVDSQDAVPASQGWRQCETVFTNSKAGMEGVDKDRVKKVVYEMSKNSAHFKNEQRKQAQVAERIQRMRKKAASLTATELAGLTRAMDAKIVTLKATQDLTRTWLHVDMDAFFASCEELDDPTLKSKPMAVGGMGMISTANYVARKFGVRSAMPGFIGKRLCPELIFVRPDFEKYTRASAAVKAILREFDADLEAGSLDEAYMDITEYCHAHDMTGSEVAELIRKRVREETKLTCSVGIGPNHLLAKVCSDYNKPDGQHALEASPTAVAHFVEALPIRKVGGIGKVTEQVLLAVAGVERCGQLIERRGLIAALFSPVSTEFFMQCGLGLGRTEHGEPLKEGEVGRKGISCERTFGAMSAKHLLEAKCQELSERLAEDMAAKGLRAKVLTLKLKTTGFEVRTRSVTLPQHVGAAADIAAAALRLLRPELPIEIRLMGIRMSSFLEVRTPPGQKSLSAFVQRRDAGGATDLATRMDAVQGDSNAVQAGPEPDAGAPRGNSAGPAEAGSAGIETGEQPMELSLGDWGPHHHSDDPELDMSLQTWRSTTNRSSEEQPSASAADLPAAQGPPHLQPNQPPGARSNPPQPSAAAPATEAWPGRVSKRWTCRDCTYAGNSRHLLRCEMCDALRIGGGNRIVDIGIDFQRDDGPADSGSGGADGPAPEMARELPMGTGLEEGDPGARGSGLREEDFFADGSSRPSSSGGLDSNRDESLPSAPHPQPRPLSALEKGKGPATGPPPSPAQPPDDEPPWDHVRESRGSDPDHGALLGGRWVWGGEPRPREWRCLQCGAWAAAGPERQEHDDMHLAAELQREENSRGSAPSRGQSRGPERGQEQHGAKRPRLGGQKAGPGRPRGPGGKVKAAHNAMTLDMFWKRT